MKRYTRLDLYRWQSIPKLTALLVHRIELNRILFYVQVCRFRHNITYACIFGVVSRRYAMFHINAAVSSITWILSEMAHFIFLNTILNHCSSEMVFRWSEFFQLGIHQSQSAHRKYNRIVCIPWDETITFSIYNWYAISEITTFF